MRSEYFSVCECASLLIHVVWSVTKDVVVVSITVLMFMSSWMSSVTFVDVLSDVNGDVFVALLIEACNTNVHLFAFELCGFPKSRWAYFANVLCIWCQMYGKL